jgi:ferredoxin
MAFSLTCYQWESPPSLRSLAASPIPPSIGASPLKPRRIHPSLWGITNSKAEGRTVHRTVDVPYCAPRLGSGGVRRGASRAACPRSATRSADTAAPMGRRSGGRVNRARLSTEKLIAQLRSNRYQFSPFAVLVVAYRGPLAFSQRPPPRLDSGCVRCGASRAACPRSATRSADTAALMGRRSGGRVNRARVSTEKLIAQLRSNRYQFSPFAVLAVAYRGLFSFCRSRSRLSVPSRL